MGVGGLWKVTPAGHHVLPKSLCHSPPHLDKGEKIECAFQCWGGEGGFEFGVGICGMIEEHELGFERTGQAVGNFEASANCKVTTDWCLKQQPVGAGRHQ